MEYKKLIIEMLQKINNQEFLFKIYAFNHLHIKGHS